MSEYKEYYHMEYPRLWREGYTTHDDYILLYTRGMCFRDGRGNQSAAYGVFWGDGPGHPEPHSARDENLGTLLEGPLQTRTRSETMAILVALSETFPFPCGASMCIKVRTDSRIAVDCWYYHEEWAANGWVNSLGAVVPNLDLVVRIAAVLSSHWMGNVVFELIPRTSQEYGYRRAHAMFDLNESPFRPRVWETWAEDFWADELEEVVYTAWSEYDSAALSRESDEEWNGGGIDQVIHSMLQ